MRSQLKKSRKNLFSTFMAVFFILTIFLIVKEVVNTQKKINSSSKAAFINNPLVPARNVVVYEPPIFASSAKALTSEETVKRFSVVLYAHNQMKQYLKAYLDAGFNGDSMIYLVADGVEGPQNLSTITNQGKTCSEIGVNPNTDVLSATATMDTGDFCEIHDAIANLKRGSTDTKLICLTEPGFTNICPTENFFIHKSDSTRVEKKRTSTSYYQPNPGDANWQKYFTQRVLRELVKDYQPGYDYVPNITGLFIDNIELSWTKLNNLIGTPKEYPTNCEYTKKVRDFTSYVHSQLNTDGRSYPVWANMISDPLTDPCGVAANSWVPFDGYLEGGMAESFVLNWGKGPYDVSHIEKEMAIGQDWVQKGNHFMAVIQANTDSRYNMYAFAAYLMLTDGKNGSYKYADTPAGKYANYYTLPYPPYTNNVYPNYPDYDAPLGTPIGERYLSSTSPDRIWTRKFKCGEVSLNLTKYTGSIIISGSCDTSSVTPTINPTPTTNPTPTAVPTATPTSVPPTNTPTPPTSSTPNLNFESGTTGWRLSTDGSASFTTSGTSAYEGNLSGLVSITTPGTLVNLYTTNLKLDPNTKYNLKFASKSNTGHDVKVVIDEQDDDYTNYGLTGYVADLTSSWKMFSYDFTTSGFSAPVSDARIRFSLGSYDATGDMYSFDSVALTPVPVCEYGPYNIPGKVESENFTCGGQNVAYYDTDSTNKGNSYRTGDYVDITATSDTGGGYYVGWAARGEWMNYKVQTSLSNAGLYTVTVRASSPLNTGKFRILVDGKDVSGQKAVPITGGWQNFRDVTVPNVNMSAGTHNVQFKIEGTNANFNYLNFSKQ